MPDAKPAGIWLAPEVLALPGLSRPGRLLLAFIDTVERRRGACSEADLATAPEVIGLRATLGPLLVGLALAKHIECHEEDGDEFWRLRFQTSGPEGLG